MVKNNLFDKISGVFNRQKDTEQPERHSKDIQGGTVKVQLSRWNAEISFLKTAIDNFEDPYHPTNEDLISIYNDVVLDSHLSALIDVRKLSVLSKPFRMVDDKGAELEETQDIEKKFFRECISLFLDSIFFGYSLVHFGDRIEKNFSTIIEVDREYVFAAGETVRNSPSSNDGKLWTAPAFAPWYLGAGNPNDLGLLSKAAINVIYKKASMSCWADFAQTFGAPLRIGRTNVQDKALRDNMIAMLREMGSDSWGVLNHDDEIEFIESSKSDAFEVFDKMIERANSELSKLILGNTMTTDDGSSRSQAEVHERVSDKITASDCVKVTEWVNSCLIPHLNKYHGFGLTGKFAFDDSEVLSMKDQFDRDISLIKDGGYKIPADYIQEKYGVPVEDVEPVGGPDVGKPAARLQGYAQLLKASVNGFYDICCAANDLPPFEGEVLTEAQEDQLYRDIYDGKVTETSLPVKLYTGTADILTQGIDGGLAEAQKLGLGYIPDQKFYDALRNNAFKFSGAKTFQQVRTMSDFLIDDDGKERSFSDFKKEAKKQFKQFNKNWLRTEYDQAFNGSQMASIWEDVLETKDEFPNLQYLTANDRNVRKDHKELDEIIKPFNSPFWNTYYPPNGWNCRCTVVKLDDSAKETPDSKLKKPDLDPDFEYNVGVTRELYSPEHPYFVTEEQFSGLASQNFGLPAAKPKKVPSNG